MRVSVHLCDKLIVFLLFLTPFRTIIKAKGPQLEKNSKLGFENKALCAKHLRNFNDDIVFQNALCCLTYVLFLAIRIYPSGVKRDFKFPDEMQRSIFWSRLSFALDIFFVLSR